MNSLLPLQVSDAAFAWKVATPAFSPLPGAYSASPSVVVSCATSGATIYYTTNGVDPTQSDSTVASGGTVAVGQSLTLKAKAWKTGVGPSNVAAGAYTLTVPTPNASSVTGTYNQDLAVTLTSATGATIRYTVDGSDPTDTSTLYTGAVPITASITLKARGTLSGWTPSGIGSFTYTMKVATPVLSPAGGSYSAVQVVTVTDATSSAPVRYTTSGLDPAPSDPSVASGSTVTVDKSVTLKAKAFRAGWTASDTTVASFSLSVGTVAAPTFSPAAGSYTASQSVSLSSATLGATLRYTTDGTTPNLTSSVFVTSISVDATTAIKAVAFKPDMTASAPASATYTLTLASVAIPTFGPSPGTYTTARSVTITCATAGAAIYYTTSGLDPPPLDTLIASGASMSVGRSSRQSGGQGRLHRHRGDCRGASALAGLEVRRHRLGLGL